MIKQGKRMRPSIVRPKHDGFQPNGGSGNDGRDFQSIEANLIGPGLLN